MYKFIINLLYIIFKLLKMNLQSTSPIIAIRSSALNPNPTMSINKLQRVVSSRFEWVKLEAARP